MSVVVVDASVVVKWFIPEPGAQAARRLLDSGAQFAAPDLLFAELGNVLWKKIRRGELTIDDGRKLFEDLEHIAIATVPCRDLFEDACALAIGTAQTVYDAMYLALAKRLETHMVTADRRFATAVAANALLAPYVRSL